MKASLSQSMRVMQKCDEKMKVMHEINEAEKKVKLSFSSSVSCIMISDFSVILSTALMLKNTSLKTLTSDLMI